MRHFRLLLLTLLFLIFSVSLTVAQPGITITTIATDLNNPRGVALLEDGRLLVAEAGTGDSEPASGTGTGGLLILNDANSDGDFDDDGEREPLVTGVPSYNSLPMFGSFHDEVFGVGDIVTLPDGSIFFTKDDPFAVPDPNSPEEDKLYTGTTGIYQVREERSPLQLINAPATINGLTYDAGRDVFFMVESGYNRLSKVEDGEVEVIVEFERLASNQQPVPAGLTMTPEGDILVALFSGFVYDYYEETISFIPGDAKIVRVTPEDGTVQDVATGLTTAIDVTIDENGNIFIVEMTTQWPTPLMSRNFDLYDPAQPPDPGGYVRYSGRISMIPADGSETLILADGLDTPTNITYADGALYVSGGLGTPGRNVLTRHGIVPITGRLYRITGF